MKKPHIQIMDNILEKVQEEIFFSKVVELESKTIYVSYLWDIRIIIDEVKKQVIFIGDEMGYSFRWTTKNIIDIYKYLDVIISRINQY